MTSRFCLVVVLALELMMVGCASQPPSPGPATSTGGAERSIGTSAKRFDGPGHSFATAIQLTGIKNPLAFSQRQQEWLWQHYRNWVKQGQALRERAGIQYDEVTLVNQRGETRVIYFRMPAFGAQQSSDQ